MAPVDLLCSDPVLPRTAGPSAMASGPSAAAAAGAAAAALLQRQLLSLGDMGRWLGNGWGITCETMEIL
jgi:hypothetical protein